MRGDRAFAALGCLALAGLSPLAAAAQEVVSRAHLPALGVDTAVRAAAAGLLLLGALLIGWGARRRESALLGGAPQTPESGIDADWLEGHVFSLAPELVGAAYDRRVAGAEVAAVLARMCGESKLASRVTGGARGWNNLELWLLVDRDELSGYERALVEALFLAGKSTSGDVIQQAYRQKGFDPAAILRSRLSAACDAALGVRRGLRWPFWLSLGGAALGLLLVPSLLAALGVAAAGLLGVGLVARAAARAAAGGIGLRRNLNAARRFFASELERPEPRLRDEWLPYLIALELTSEVDRWYQAFGRIETAARRQRLAQPVASEAGAAPSAWTGGAGALGGTGASGPWIAATAGLTVLASGERRWVRKQRRPGLQLKPA